MLLLFGVSMFSYIMGIFMEILKSYKALNDDVEEEVELGRFLGFIRHHNGKAPIKQDFRERIEHFFQYKWQFDKNGALNDPRK